MQSLSSQHPAVELRVSHATTTSTFTCPPIEHSVKVARVVKGGSKFAEVAGSEQAVVVKVEGVEGVAEGRVGGQELGSQGVRGMLRGRVRVVGSMGFVGLGVKPELVK